MMSMQPRKIESTERREQLAAARGTADLDGKHYLFEFDSERGGPVKIRLASASGWDGGGREFAGRMTDVQTETGKRVIQFSGQDAIEYLGSQIGVALAGSNPDAHDEIQLVRITEQPDGVVLYERQTEDGND